jgi:hypothetical protein
MIKEYFIKHKEHFNKGFYLFFLNLGIISSILYILNNTTSLNIDIIISSIWLFAISIFSFMIAVVMRYNIGKNEYVQTIFEVSPYFFLSILVIIAINQFLKLDFILDRNFHLVILGIAFGFITFYSNRDKVEKELEDEKKKEDEDENRRYGEFPSKFPRINRIWGLRSIVRWMYKEGWWYSFGLLGIVLIGFVLRVTKAGYFPYLRDEFNILSEAKIYFYTGDFVYTQMFHLIYLQNFIYHIFGFTTSQLVNRFPYILFGILNIVLIYYLSKSMFNKKIGVLSSLIFSLSLFSINLSLYIREYELNLLLLSMFSILIVNSYKKNYRLVILSLVYWIIIVISFYMKSNFIATIIIIPLLIFYCFDFRLFYINLNKKILLSMFGLISLFLLFFLRFIDIWWLFNLDHNYKFFNFLIFESMNIGYLQKILFFVIVSSCIFIIFSRGINVPRYYIFFIQLLIFFFTYYTFLFGRYFAPRYTYYLYGFFIIFISFNLYYLFSKNKKILLVISSILIISLFLAYVSYFSKMPWTNFSVGASVHTDETTILNIIGLGIDIHEDTIISSNIQFISFYMYDFYRYPCLKIIDEYYNYESPCNLYPLEQINNISLSEIKRDKPLYIMSDRATNPFKGEDIAIEGIEFELLNLSYGSPYKYYIYREKV